MADDDPLAELKALDAELDAATAAHREHFYSGIAVGRAGGWPDTSIDATWLDRHEELHAAVDRTRAAVRQAQDRWLARRRG